MDLLALLGASDNGDNAGHAWLVRNVLSHLELIDAMRLIVVVLESGDRFDVRRLVHWLRRGDAPIPPIDENALLDQAAMHSCWRALITLLEDLKERSPSWATRYADHIQEVAVLPTTSSSWQQRATVAHRGTHYRFGIHVISYAASQGYLPVVQWLLPRSARESGQVEPTQSAADRDRRFTLTEILRSAANARQLHVVDWVVQTSPHVNCVLPYDAELDAVAWIVCDDKNPDRSEYASVSAAHGFSSRRGDTYAPDKPFVTRMTHLPLAEGFARDGNLATFEKIYARANHRQLIGDEAIAEAAEHYHLDVVQWIHSRFPHALTEACVEGAVRGGHIAMLEWLQQRMILHELGSLIMTAGVRYGHAHVLRWYASINKTTSRAVIYSSLAVAVNHGDVEVAQFLLENYGFPVVQNLVEVVLVDCPRVEMHEYILDRVVPPVGPQDDFLGRVLNQITCPLLDVVQYLVLARGFWSRKAFEASIHHRDLTMAQFFYLHAQVRAEKFQTTRAEELDFTGIAIGQVCETALAEWLLTLPEELPVWLRWPRPSIDDGLLTSPARQRVLIACIRHRPDECRAVAWLPVWAVHIRSLDALELLYQVGHPHMRDVATFQAIIQHSRDTRFLLKLLPLPTQEEYQHAQSLTNKAIDWAARFGMVSVLEHVLKDRDATSQKQLLLRAAQQKGFFNHTQVVDWLLKRCERRGVASTTTIAQAIAGAATRHGHTWSLASLVKRQLLGDLVRWMVMEAAKRRQVQSLEWLLGNCTVSTELLARTLVEAVQLKHTEIVELLTVRYEPSELSVGSDDRVRIRAFLQKQASGGSEHAPHDSHEQVPNEKTNSSPRQKRSRRGY